MVAEPTFGGAFAASRMSEVTSSLQLAKDDNDEVPHREGLQAEHTINLAREGRVFLVNAQILLVQKRSRAT
jgi:hypothetical protein